MAHGRRSPPWLWGSNAGIRHVNTHADTAAYPNAASNNSETPFPVDGIAICMLIGPDGPGSGGMRTIRTMIPDMTA